MFKPANHSTRIPSVLQPYTKENAIFQLTLLVVFLGVMWTGDAIEEHKLNKRLNRFKTIV